MKKAVLLISHEGANSQAMCYILGQNPRIQYVQTNAVYNHPDVVEALTNYPHKLNNSAAVWLDKLLYNYSFSHKSIYKFCKFIYLIREPRPVLNEIIHSKLHGPSLTRYYCYRLRRIYEMARKTPGSLLLTHEDAYTGRVFPIIEKFLGLKDPLVLDQSLFSLTKSNSLVTNKMAETCQNAYERYLFLLKNLPLKRFEF